MARQVAVIALACVGFALLPWHSVDALPQYTSQALVSCDRSDSSAPCDHRCCTPGPKSAGSCQRDSRAAASYMCTCRYPFVATADGSQCVCPRECPQGFVQDHNCECLCPVGNVCKGASCELYEDEATGTVIGVVPASCDSCTCEPYSCPQGSVLKDKQCQCPANHACSSSTSPQKCLSRIEPYGQMMHSFYPWCEDCTCDPVDSCRPEAFQEHLFQQDQLFVGSVDCGSTDQAAIWISEVTGHPNYGASVEADVYAPIWLDGKDMTAVAHWQLIGEYDSDSACFLLKPRSNQALAVPRNYFPLSFSGTLDEVASTPVLFGRMNQCHGQNLFNFQQAAICARNGSMYLDTLALDCHLVDDCLPGEYVDLDPTLTSNRVCKPCPDDQFSDGRNAKECQPIPTCPPGEYLDYVPGFLSQAKCQPCPDGTFSDKEDSFECTPVTVCDAQQTEFRPPTPSSDRLCSYCSSPSEYQDVNGVCQPIIECDPGEYMVVDATPTSNRICSACEDSTFSTEKNAPSCSAWKRCQPGSYLLVPGSNTRDTRCGRCPRGQYSDTFDLTSCKDPSVCPAGKEQTAPATLTSDTVCRECPSGKYKPSAGQGQCQPAKTCEVGTFVSKQSTPTSNRDCDACPSGSFTSAPNLLGCSFFSECDPGWEEDQAPSPSSDRTCRRCHDGFFQPSTIAGPVAMAACQPHRNCTDDQYETKPGSRTADRLCAPLTKCKAGEYEYHPPTPTTDRTCEKCTECGASKYELSPCTPTSDRRCGDCSNLCGENQYMQQDCTATSDPVCRDCTPCPAGHYASIPCHAHEDTTCAPLTICQPNEYEAKPPTKTSDRTCMPVSQCDFKEEFELAPPTPTSDRKCRRVSTCRPPYREAKPPTRTSDRVCVNCPAGYSLQVDGPPKCIPCQNGTYVPAASMGRCTSFVCDRGTFDDDNDASTPCVDCPPDSFQDEKGQTSCKPALQCTPAGTEVDPSSVTTSTDRRCRMCPLNTFKPKDGPGECLDVTRCGPGTYLKEFSTITTDTVCQPCPEGQFKSEIGQFPCEAWTECWPGQYEARPPTATSDRLCLPCPEEMFQAETGQKRCISATQCGPGMREIRPLTPHSDRLCGECMVGINFKASNHTAGTCSGRVTECPAGTEEAQPPTASSDRECRPCEADHTFRPELDPFPCLPVHICPAGEGEVAPPTLSSDTVCERCKLGETFSNITSRGAPCHPVTQCGPDLYEIEPPTISSDRVCAPLTRCLTTEFEAAAPSLTSDRVCRLCRNCPEGQSIVSQCSRFNDTVCSECPVCQSGEYLPSDGCDVANGGTCKTCSTCDLKTSYVFRPCTANSDAECRPLTVCASDEFEAVPPTPTSDRRCQRARVCPPGFYQSEAATSTSDTICTPVTRNCRATVGLEVIQETTTSDRICRPCQQGFADIDGDPLTACRPCVRGSVMNDGSGVCSTCLPGTVDPLGAIGAFCQPCVDGTFQSQPGQRTCTSFRACGPGFEPIPNTERATQDRMCRPCKMGKTYSHDGLKCRPVTQCNPGFEEAKAPTLTSDRQCKQCPDGTFKTANDHRCHPVNNCPSGMEPKAEPTRTSDRVCRQCPMGKTKSSPGNFECEVKECEQGQFTVKPATLNMFPECQDIRQCRDDEIEIVPPTFESNRVCAVRADQISTVLRVPVSISNLDQAGTVNPASLEDLKSAVTKAIKTEVPGIGIKLIDALPQAEYTLLEIFVYSWENEAKLSSAVRDGAFEFDWRNRRLQATWVVSSREVDAIRSGKEAYLQSLEDTLLGKDVQLRRERAQQEAEEAYDSEGSYPSSFIASAIDNLMTIKQTESEYLPGAWLLIITAALMLAIVVALHFWMHSVDRSREGTLCGDLFDDHEMRQLAVAVMGREPGEGETLDDFMTNAMIVLDDPAFPFYNVRTQPEARQQLRRHFAGFQNAVQERDDLVQSRGPGQSSTFLAQPRP